MRTLPLSVSTITAGLLAVAGGFGLALVLNAYLESRYFSLPSVQVKGEAKKTVERKVSYRHINFVMGSGSGGELPAVETGGGVSTATGQKNLELVGTATVGSKRLAFVRENGKLKLVKEGDRVGGFTVKKISKFYLEGEKDGRKYRLTISPKPSPQTESGSTKKVQVPAKVKEEGSRQVVKLEKRFVEEKTADIGSLMKDVLIQPVVKDGETVGFMFRYVKPNSLLYNLGLRSGDMIVSVNGRSIKTVEEAFKIYNILRNENTVEVVIKRRGKEKTLVFEIQ
ncbi:MAG: hypothetical protein GXN94_02160 [Aquificae bacterium]|nr:hypothetical protein [Aquificota bacterium]